MEFRDLKLEDYPSFLKVYNTTLPEGKKREFEDEKHLDNFIKMKGGKFHAFTAVDGDLYLGFISYWTFEGYTYIEHLAVSPENKGKNLERLLLNHLFKEVSPNVLIQVEADDLKQIEFLEKNEFKMRREFHYNTPKTQNGATPVEMLLMSHGDVNLHNIDSIKDMLQEVYNLNSGR